MTLRPLLAAAVTAFGLVLPLVATSGAVHAETSPEPPTEVAIVVALTVPAPASGLLDAETLEEYTAETGLLSRELDQVIDRPVTLGIDPMIIASIRLLGTDAPESAVLWLDRLAAATNDTFPLAWADADVTAPLQAGSPVVLAPDPLDFAIDSSRFGEAVEQPTATPTPGATPTLAPEDQDGPPPLPTTEALLDWDYTLPSAAWPRTDTVTNADLAILGATVDYTLVSSTNLGGAIPTGSRGSASGAELLVVDDTLSSLFSSTIDPSPGTDWQTGAAALDAALTSASATSTSIVIALDRTAPLGDPELAATIDLVAANPALAMVGLGDLAANPGDAVTVADLPHQAERIAEVAELLADEQAEHTFLQIAENPAYLTAERRLMLLAVLSSGITEDVEGWAEATQTFHDRSLAIRSAVGIVRSSAITLWADRGSLPVVVGNDLSQAVTVYIRVRPSSPLLRVEDDFVELTIEPNSQRKAQIPVQSISNGDVDLEISLHKANDAIIGEATHVRTTVQAGWETPVTIVAAIVVFLIFVAGIVRTVLKRRRMRQEAV